MTSISKTLLNWLIQCPHLGGFVFSVDYLSESPFTCAIENSGDTLLKTFSDGSLLKRYVFLISLRLPYADDTDVNATNAELIELLRQWVESGIALPRLDGSRKSICCRVLSDGYVYYADSMTAKYQLKLALDYHSSF
ncbi:MAG: hypothetical protein IJF27_03360 [Oscillospiraceae bacterium]|nr:hypothetical protein [Oscillospiraceae bacterium]MBQ3049304.1 hypothetical protein [Oscillospiraceae bacterium]